MTTQYKVSQLPAAVIGNTATDVAVVNVAGATSKVTIQDIANKGAAAITPTGGTMGVVGAVTATGGFGGNATTATLAATATALANVRLLWGQSFDGTANVNGVLAITQPSTSAGLTVTTSSDVSTSIDSINTNAVGTTANANLRADASTAVAVVQANGSGRVASRWGVTLADWVEFRNLAGSGVALGTINNTPLILGTSALNRIQIAGTGEVTVATAATFSSTVGVNSVITATVNGKSDGIVIAGDDNNNVKLRLANNGPSGETWQLQVGAQGANNIGLRIRDVTTNAEIAGFFSSGVLVTALNATTTVKTGSFTVATLPAAATVGIGGHAWVTDSQSIAFAAAAIGGGGFGVAVMTDGSGWYVG